MSKIEEAFEAGYRAYRDAFDHYDDTGETVEHSLKWRMAEYVAAQQERALDGANVCRVIEHVYIDGTCAQCGSPEPPRK